MSCVPTDRRRATGWLLSLRLGAVLGIAILGMGLIVDQLLGRSLADRDRELLKARLENYQRIAGHGELAKLYGVLDEEQQEACSATGLSACPPARSMARAAGRRSSHRPRQATAGSRPAPAMAAAGCSDGLRSAPAGRS
ncbi:hypothetical protein [Marinobacterium aestuariivivens]|uniref:Uncharacterized protein n=1 Tax=Marinobacterium aestuariivivens TaxID=1698799 RepID=A0ABW2A738_9GAMM